MLPFDLKQTAQEVVDQAKSMAEQKGLTLSFAVDDGAGPYAAHGDKGQIADHVLRNIVENAIHYTPSGKVEVSLKKEGNKFVFAV